MKNLRDHGLGDVELTHIGTPTWTASDDPNDVCPNCKARVVNVSVPLSAPILRGNNGVGRYKGCPACPWAGPMIAVADAANT